MRRLSLMFAIAALAVSGLAPLTPVAMAASAPAAPPPETAPAAKVGPVETGFVPGTRSSSDPANADSRVLSVIEAQAKGAKAAVAQARASGLTVAGERVRVIVQASDAVKANAAIVAGGATVEATAGDLIQVLATPDQLSHLIKADGIAYVRAPLPRRAEAISDEGVLSTNAANVQAGGATGAGVKIAIVDLGFKDLAAAQASGDLPASLTTVDYCGGALSTATAHGTGVSQIVHKMAPDADLYLICIDTEVDLVTAEQYAKANGITIVNHSVGWYNSSRGDGTGTTNTPDWIVADAAANGILWVNAAGNDATGHWSGTFIDDNSGYHRNVFNTSSHDIGNSFFLPAGRQVCAFLKWDAWPTTNQDYDLYLVASSSNYAVAYSETSQTGGQWPTEETCYTNDSGYDNWFFVGIIKYSATLTPRFDLYLLGADLEYQVAAGSVAEPASSPSAFAVGAHCWQGTAIEPYSSQGPTIDGRKKPDISGPDQTSSSVYGSFSTCNPLTGFAGTSAAAPHVAGAAVLVKSEHPTYTATQIKAYLQTYSIDQGAAGADNIYGSGELHLPGPPAVPTSVTAAGYNQSAGVWWTAPTDGGRPITGYTVTASDGIHTCTTTGATRCTVAGLTNGTPYTFTVKAANDVGTSPVSDVSNSVIPAAVPDAPVVTAIGTDSTISISWTVPADNGSAITGYTATANPGAHTCTTTTELACQIGGLANKTAYTISVVATNGNGPGAPGFAGATVTPRAGATYFGLTPSRLLDTRYNIGITGRVQSHVAASFQVTGLAPGDPYRNVPADATAVTGFVSVSGSVAAGWLSVTPEPLNYPTTSTLNFPAGDKRSTGVTVPLGSGGKLSVTYGAILGPTILTDVIFDITGYFVTNSSGSTYTALTPNRLVDSRAGATNTGITDGQLVSGIAKTFSVVNRTPADATKNVPSGAVAVTGTLTVTNQTSAGFLTLGPDALNAPPTTSLFFAANPAKAKVLDNRATGVTVKLSPTGTLGITFTGASGTAKTDVIFDVTGYFMPGASGATYVPVSPNRVLDSRPTGGGVTNAGYLGKIKQRVPVTFYVVNRTPSDPTTNVPTGAVAVTGILTVTTQTAAGYLSLTNYPVVNPTTSSLNFPAGDNRATGVTVPLSATGTLSVTYGAVAGSTTNVIFDVSGYFLN